MFNYDNSFLNSQIHDLENQPNVNKPSSYLHLFVYDIKIITCHPEGETPHDL